MIIFHAVFIACFGIVFLGVFFFLRGKFILAASMMLLSAAMFIYCLVTSDRHESRYFTKTGIPQSESVQQIRKFLPVPLIIFCAIGMIMEQYGVFPAHLRVPISAVYVCPLLIFANLRWARGSFIGYLWALLYGGWALAIVFKVPVLTFSGDGQMKPGDEMFLAVPVTGLITGLIAYIYSRYALKKLKNIAHVEGEAAHGA